MYVESKWNKLEKNIFLTILNTHQIIDSEN